MFSFYTEPGLATAAAIVVVAYLLLYRLQTLKSHPDEPPIIASAVPYVGHLLGMLFNGGRYVKSIGYEYITAAVQRASKALSFTPLVPDVTKRVLGLDDQTVNIVRQNLDPEPGDPRGFLADIHDMVYSYLGPGEPLNEISFGAAQELSRQVNAYAAQLDGTDTVDLLVLVRHLVAIATAQFLYGPKNPIAVQPALEERFWDFDHGLGQLIIGVMPSVIARKPYAGREALAKGFAEYIEAGHHKTGSRIIQNRISIAEQYGWTVDAAARSEVSFLFAGIVNTATTTFWILLQIFSRPDLLATVREELQKAVNDDPSTGERLLSMDTIKTDSPTLFSVFRECLRAGSDNYSTRLVKADTVLAGRYHLKAGSVVQIAGGVIHADKGIWGADADDFNPGRFLKLQSGSGQGQVHPAAFRAFGGGKTLCPGRHFATNEITAFVAMMVLTLEVQGLDGAGIMVPGKEDGVLPVHILEPKSKVKVQVRVRDRRGIRVVRILNCVTKKSPSALNDSI